MRPALVTLLALAALAIMTAAGAQVGSPPGSVVDVERVERPGVIVAEKAFALTVHLENRASEPQHVYLFTALYDWEAGNPCGNAADERFRGFVHRVQPSITLAAGESTTYPRPTDPLPWHQRANASQVGAGGKLELCVFAATTEAASGATLTYLDYLNFTVEARPENRAPEASFTFTPPVPNATMPVAFTATATDPDGDALTYEWDFGRFDHSGRARATGPEATHAFYPDGTFTVTLTVRDPWDATTVARDVRVLPESEPAVLPPPTGTADEGWWPVPAPGAPFAALAAAAAALIASRARR